MAKRDLKEIIGKGEFIFKYESPKERKDLVKLINPETIWFENDIRDKGYIVYDIEDSVIGYHDTCYNRSYSPASDFLEGEIEGYKVKEDKVEALNAIMKYKYPKADFVPNKELGTYHVMVAYLEEINLLKEFCDPIYKEEKPKFEKGKGYIIPSRGAKGNTQDALVISTKTGESLYGYGVNWRGEWGDEGWVWDSEGSREATHKEVEEAFKKYAVDVLGFKEGVYTNCLYGFGKNVMINGKGIHCNRTLKEMWADAYVAGDNICIMKDGKWAEIIEQEPQLPEINGKQVEYFNSGLHCGCYTITTKRFLKLLKQAEKSGVKSITFQSGGESAEVTIEQMNQIRTYIEFKEKNK